MRSLVPVVLAALLSAAAVAHAGPQAKPASPAAAGHAGNAKAAASRYAGEAVIIEDADTHYRYNADGTGSMVKHMRVKVQDEAGARAFSVLSIAYESATQSAKMLSVKVIHPDGRTVVTPASDDMDQPARVTQEAPLYSDLKVLQAPVRGLRPGDTLEYTMRIDTNKAQVPGEFWSDCEFLKKLVVLKQTVTLNVPAQKHVQVWSGHRKPEVTVRNGRRIYRWKYSQTKPTKELDKKKTAASHEVKPSIAWTTFASWQALGAWYRCLARQRAAPTPALRAKADAITQGAKTPEEQVRAIYDFVSTQIRYIGVDFGIGRFQPHPAAVVLDNQYGDCKDKDTLLEALLRAKGFHTAPALIGAGVKMIPTLPTPGVFNHVITTVTINGKQVWMDSTPGVAPFRMLVPQLRHKQALVIPATGAAHLEWTPAKPPFALVDRMDATATLTAKGDLTAQMVIEDHSDSEVLLRGLAQDVPPAQWDRIVQYLSRLMGFGGTVSHAEFSSVEDLEKPIRLTYDYKHPKFGDWSDLQILPLFPAISIPGAPDKKPTKAIKLGSERTDIAKTVMHLPQKFTPQLPDAVHLKTEFATFDRTYSFEKGTLTVRRKLVILASKVPPDDWKAYRKFLKDASIFKLNFIQLETNGGGQGSGTTAASKSTSNSKAKLLVSEANGMEKSRDWKGALKLLDKAKAIAPRQAYLWSNYGWVAMQQNHVKKAERAFRRELKYHPDEPYAAKLYAAALLSAGKNRQAKHVLTRVFKKRPSDTAAAVMLAGLESRSNLGDAIRTMQQAMAASPGNARITAVLAELLKRNHESDKAAALLKKQIETAKDQATLNNDSYELATMGRDLKLDEQKSRQAVSQLADQTSQAEVAGANNAEFIRAQGLVADWDTLGYILMKEGKLKEAGRYLEATWNDDPTLIEGLHYGTLLEKEGHPAKALRIYELSRNQESNLASPEDRRQLAAAILRLKQAHVHAAVKDPDAVLQNMRTFTLEAAGTPKVYEKATFRLQFAADGPPEVMQVNGSAAMAQFVKKIRTLHFPRFVPESSKARLLRDAAMSCSAGYRKCVLVLMPMGTMRAENPSSTP